MNYAGTELAGSLSIRKRIVMYVINWHLKDLKRITKD
jgi:hypothetical protein